MIALLLWSCAEDMTTVPLDPVATLPNVQVELHPTQAIDVSWTTEDPLSTWVEFGEGAFARRIGQEEPSTEHSVTIVGVRADTEVSIRAVSGDLSSDTITVQVPPLPWYVSNATLVTYDRDRADGGWTLVNSGNRVLDWPATAVIYDAEGFPVWFHAPQPDTEPPRLDMDVVFTVDNTVLFGGASDEVLPTEIALDGTLLWQGQTDVPLQHHHIDKLEDGSYVALRHQYVDAVDYGQIVITDPDDELLWRWEAKNYFEPPAGDSLDPLHFNSVTIASAQDAYINSRELSTIFKIDRETGEVVWGLGRAGEFELAEGLWYGHQHDPELQEDGSWLVYDNSLNGASRVVRVRPNEDSMTASIEWEFPGTFDVHAWYTDSWFSSIWGDADQLDNGNVLVTFGSNSPTKESRLFEVAPDGEVVWALRMESPDDASAIAVYQGQRIAPFGEPIAVAPTE